MLTTVGNSSQQSSKPASQIHPLKQRELTKKEHPCKNVNESLFVHKPPEKMARLFAFYDSLTSVLRRPERKLAIVAMRWILGGSGTTDFLVEVDHFELLGNMDIVRSRHGGLEVARKAEVVLVMKEKKINGFERGAR